MKKIHFIGVGGIGMSGLAEICLSRGYEITGSDLDPNNLTDELEKNGAGIFRGHSADNIGDNVSLVVKSSCIRDDNPEVIKALDAGISVILRGELLKDLMCEMEDSIGITGTHGKTTTSGLTAQIFEECGRDPTVVVGGEMEIFKSNAKPGKGNVLIAEVDESDGFFRNVSAASAIITNIEREHMENYASFDDLLGAYRQFVDRLSPGGVLVFNGEDGTLSEMARESGKNTLSFGIDGDFDVTCRGYSCGKSIEFELMFRGKRCGRIKSPLVGRYNLMNILAAVGLSMEKGIGFDRIKDAVGNFRGVRRRFDLVGKAGGVEIIEDYAHHPTELRSVIKAAGDYGAGRVIAVFQPHRFSRTRDLMAEFSECFYGADVLILTDIYSAHEDADEKVDIRDLFGSLDSSRFESVAYLPKKDIPAAVSRVAKRGDIVLVLGAGDIRDISGDIVREIANKAYE